MARKLTIKRLGLPIPALCLIALLGLVLVATWLSIFGFPGFVLRAIEERVEREGIYLRLDKLSLWSISGLGLEAEALRLYAQKPTENATETPLVRLPKAQVRLRGLPLLFGKIEPNIINFEHGQINLENISLDDITGSFSQTRQGNAILNLPNLWLEGIHVEINLEVSRERLAQLFSSEPSSEPLNLAEELAAIKPYCIQAHHIIALQQWSQEQPPHILINGKIDKHSTSNISARFSRFDYNNLKLRDIILDTSFRNQSILINKLDFKTHQPEAEFSLQGGYDIRSRSLSFRLNSNASVLRIARQFLGDDEPEIMRLLSTPKIHPPRIQLYGDVELSENFNLEQATINGELSQRGLMIGNNEFENTELSFFYKNGNFFINSLSLSLPEDAGKLTISASAADGQGEASLNLDITTQAALTLINSFLPEAEHIHLPQGLKFNGPINLQIHTLINTPQLNDTLSTWQEYIPTLREIELTLSGAGAQYEDFQLTRPQLQLKLAGLKNNSDCLPISSESIQIIMSVEQLSSTGTSLEKLQTEGKNLRLEAQLQQCNIDYERIEESINALQAQLKLFSQQIHFGDVKLDSIDVELSNLRNIAPQTTSINNLFEGGQLEAHISNIQYKGEKIGDASLELNLNDDSKTPINLSLKKEGQEFKLSLDHDWVPGENLTIRDIDCELPLELFTPILMAAGLDELGISLAENARIKGDICLKLDQEIPSIYAGEFDFVIPHLTRRPKKLYPFRGKSYTVALAGKLRLGEIKDGSFNYVLMPLTVTHDTGRFTGSVSGNSDTHLKMRGDCTMRPDIIDALIDNTDAHSIIRDFKFTDKSQAHAANIKLDIDYTNGLDLQLSTDATLRNTSYLICAIEALPNGIEKLRTDLGSTPFVSVNTAQTQVVVDIQLRKKDAQGRPIKDIMVLHFNQPRLTYNNLPWLAQNGISNGNAECTAVGDKVIIDIENSYAELIGLRGQVYPAYAISMFYADIRQYLEALKMSKPATMECGTLVFPIYSDCKRPMSGVIRMEHEGPITYAFLGTNIPFSDFSGFIHLSDDYIILDRLNARCWGGVADLDLRIGISTPRTSFDGYVTAHSMNLKEIAASYNSKQDFALCEGALRFRSPSPDVNAIQGYGHVNIEDGSLLKLGLFAPLASFLTDLPNNIVHLENSVNPSPEKPPGLAKRAITRSLSVLARGIRSVGNFANNIPFANNIFKYDLQEAYSEFTLANGHLYSERMKAKGYNINVDVNLDIDLNSLTLRGNLWPRINSLPTIILSPLTVLSKYIIDIVLYGPIDDINWAIGLDPNLKNDRNKSRSPERPQSITQP